MRRAVVGCDAVRICRRAAGMHRTHGIPNRCLSTRWPFAIASLKPLLERKPLKWLNGGKPAGCFDIQHSAIAKKGQPIQNGGRQHSV